MTDTKTCWNCKHGRIKICDNHILILHILILCPKSDKPTNTNHCCDKWEEMKECTVKDDCFYAGSGCSNCSRRGTGSIDRFYKMKDPSNYEEAKSLWEKGMP